jgi:hypothetical protein
MLIKRMSCVFNAVPPWILAVPAPLRLPDARSRLPLLGLSALGGRVSRFRVYAVDTARLLHDRFCRRRQNTTLPATGLQRSPASTLIATPSALLRAKCSHC